MRRLSMHAQIHSRARPQSEDLQWHNAHAARNLRSGADTNVSALLNQAGCQPSWPWPEKPAALYELVAV
jgi:hypothetical protein